MLDKNMANMNTEQAGMAMPLYRCHKEVWALKIKALMNPNEGVPDEDNGERVVTFEDAGYEACAWILDTEYMQKHKPQPGGYYVVYKDGYKSFSPAAAFEEGYTRI